MFLESSASIWNFRRCLRWSRIGGQKDKSADFAHLAPPAINDLEVADGQILVVASLPARATQLPRRATRLLLRSALCLQVEQECFVFTCQPVAQGI